jgi:hypothetical protein
VHFAEFCISGLGPCRRYSIFVIKCYVCRTHLRRFASEEKNDGLAAPAGAAFVLQGRLSWRSLLFVILVYVIQIKSELCFWYSCCASERLSSRDDRTAWPQAHVAWGRHLIPT